jgi:hypothetical protein
MPAILRAWLPGMIGKPRAIPGLCAHCQHAQQVESDRGSVFLRCELALTDKRFPKYPRLPVLVCSGYNKRTSEG